MTCIIGLKDNGKVYIGGDSAGVGGWDLTIRADEKVFRNGPMLFGFTTSFRMGQLLRYSLVIPIYDPHMPLREYMSTLFIDAVRTCLKEGGYAKKENEVEKAGEFLVGFQGEIFIICDDYQVGVSIDGYAATGCGAQVALGALFTTEGQPAKDRVLKGLEAAEHLSAGVRRPFVILEI